jgi:hypothetical protein
MNGTFKKIRNKLAKKFTLQKTKLNLKHYMANFPESLVNWWWTWLDLGEHEWNSWISIYSIEFNKKLNWSYPNFRALPTCWSIILTPLASTSDKNFIVHDVSWLIYVSLKGQIFVIISSNTISIFIYIGILFYVFFAYRYFERHTYQLQLFLAGICYPNVKIIKKGSHFIIFSEKN